MTWLPSSLPTVVEYLVDASGRVTGHQVQRGTLTGVYSGSCHGEPVGSSSMEIYSVRKQCEADARGKP